MIALLYYLFILFQIGFILYLFYFSLSFIKGAPYVPSKKRTAEIMINFAHIKPGMMVYDLGSGDGRLLFLAAKRGATAIGYEINPILVIYSEIIKLFSGCRHNIKFIWKDFWKANLENADIVFIYLLPWKMDRLKTILLYQLKPGALVISNSFIFPKWKIYQQDTLNHIYVFRV